MQYTLRATPTSTQYIVKGATWADWDQRGRLVFARAGKLLAAQVDDPEAARRHRADGFQRGAPGAEGGTAGGRALVASRYASRAASR